MRLSSEQVTASVGLGGILMERGQYSDAIRLWEDALAKNAGLELVRVNLAMAYWRSGNLRSAETHLVKAVDLSPGFAPAADLLRQLRRQNARQQGRWRNQRAHSPPQPAQNPPESEEALHQERCVTIQVDSAPVCGRTSFS